MRSGYLLLEQHPAHPGLLRARLSEDAPHPPAGEDGAELVYAAWCADVDTARMHLHEALRRRLVDIDAGLYRSTLATAAGAIEGGSLGCSRTWIAPRIEDAEAALISHATAKRRRQLRRQDRFWKLLAGGMLLLLVLHVVI